MRAAISAKPRLPVANELDRALQFQMHDEMVGSYANGSGEYAREMEGTAPRHSCERGDLDRLIEMGNDIVSGPLEHVQYGTGRIRLAPGI